jgi:uncharacterized protein YndB with AHSA1/START domain
MTAAHATFHITRELKAAPARVFAAWADPVQKRAWFACHDDWQSVDYALDFRVGGHERNVVAPPGGEHHYYEARYFDIVDDERIVYAYDMRLGQKRISVSLATVELAARRGGCKMSFTEQVVFFDGYRDDGERQRGTEALLDNLAAWLGARS